MAVNRYEKGIRKSSLKRGEEEAKRQLKLISDIRKLNREGFLVPRNPMKKITKSSAELNLKKFLSKKQNKKFIGRAFVKAVQDLKKPRNVYIIVIRRGYK